MNKDLLRAQLLIEAAEALDESNATRRIADIYEKRSRLESDPDQQFRARMIAHPENSPWGQDNKYWHDGLMNNKGKIREQARFLNRNPDDFSPMSYKGSKEQMLNRSINKASHIKRLNDKMKAKNEAIDYLYNILTENDY